MITGTNRKRPLPERRYAPGEDAGSSRDNGVGRASGAAELERGMVGGRRAPSLPPCAYNSAADTAAPRLPATSLQEFIREFNGALPMSCPDAEESDINNLSFGSLLAGVVPLRGLTPSPVLFSPPPARARFGVTSSPLNNRARVEGWPEDSTSTQVHTLPNCGTYEALNNIPQPLASLNACPRCDSLHDQVRQLSTELKTKDAQVERLTAGIGILYKTVASLSELLSLRPHPPSLYATLCCGRYLCS